MIRSDRALILAPRGRDGAVAVALLQGADLRLSVSDTGMDENMLKSAIEPFFTTRQIGKGTGLGL